MEEALLLKGMVCLIPLKRRQLQVTEIEICLPMVLLFSQLAPVLDPESRSYRKAEGLLCMSVLAAWHASL